MSYRALTAALLLTWGCAGTTTGTRNVEPVSETAAPVVTSMSPTPGASVALRPGTSDRVDEDVRAAVLAWSEALDRHDVDGLGRLYEEYVRLYGGETPVPRARVVASKRAAFAKEPTFRQEVVGGIDVVRETDGGFTARFTKRSGQASAPNEVRARLLLRRSADGGFVVWEESDDPSDVAAQARSSPAATCEATAARVVHARPEVAAFEDRVSRSPNGAGHLGGRGPNDAEDDSFVADVGVMYDDHFEPHVSYTVRRRTGELKLTVDAMDVALGTVERAAVARACRR